MTTWTRLGAGSYNIAYRSDDGLQVLKIQKKKGATPIGEYDSPQRSVRLWNELNPKLPPPAYLAQTAKGTGWVCPYVEGRQASDDEMSAALIDIFNSSGRIVVDATAPKNFVTTPRGQVVCVDIGMALQMEKREEAHFGRRKKSMTSLDAWKELHNSYIPFLNECKTMVGGCPHTVDTVKALLFITSNRPDIFDLSFLKDNPLLVEKLAKAYDPQGQLDVLGEVDTAVAEQKASVELVNGALNALVDKAMAGQTPEEVREGRKILKEERPITFENSKESCIKQVEKYIQSRGLINHQGHFKPSWMTIIFRNMRLTTQKIEEAKQLIEHLRSADSLDEISQAIASTQTHGHVKEGRFFHGMASCLGKCMLIVDVAQKELLTKDIATMLNSRLS